MRSAHSGVKFDCQYCELNFTRKYLLDNHLKKAHSKMLKNENSDLVTPVKNVPVQPQQNTKPNSDKKKENEELKKIKCEFCSQTFVSTFLKNRHVSSDHNKHKSKCEPCGKTFTREYFLREHIDKYHPIGK